MGLKPFGPIIDRLFREREKVLLGEGGKANLTLAEIEKMAKERKALRKRYRRAKEREGQKAARTELKRRRGRRTNGFVPSGGCAMAKGRQYSYTDENGKKHTFTV